LFPREEESTLHGEALTLVAEEESTLPGEEAEQASPVPRVCV
jgi:hypothetical protein